MPDISSVDIGLFSIFLAVLLGPFFFKVIEHNLEVFLFINGVIAASISWVWTPELVQLALEEPIIQGIVPAVLIAGLAFHYGRRSVDRWMKELQKKVSVKVIVFTVVVGLGFLSSIITAIIAALLLVEFVHFIPLDRKNRVELTIIACFSIGVGAALTPLGEPLSVIAVTALKPHPYHADFFWLARNLGIYIIPGVLFFGVLGVLFVQGTRHRLLKIISLPDDYYKEDERTAKVLPVPAVKCPRCDTLVPHRIKKGPLKCTNCGKRIKHIHHDKTKNGKGQKDCKPVDLPHEPLKEVFIRAFKVYVFVMALILLGKGMGVLVEKYFTLVPPMALYWINMVSAVLDNATLAAAEIGPALTLFQIKSALVGLLVAGGMLIPGNIPNIICAQKLKISSKEWARVGIPLGIGVMFVYFIWLYLPMYIF